jgi:uncharacterized protein YcbK (DUF882 family)
MTWKHFTEEEVKSLNPDLVELLDRARGIALTPFIITSGLRTVEENNMLTKSVQDSAHLSGLAVDLKCSTSMTRFKILKGLYAVGFCRIGIYSSHIHVDIDDTKPQGVVWFG